MYQGQINVRYAKALFQLAVEKGIVDEIKQDIDLIFETFQEVDNFNILIEHPVIKASKKAQILSDLFEKKVHQYTLSFLHLIVKNKRENHIKNICIDFIDLYTKHKGIKRAVLTTAFNLSRTQEAKVKRSIEKAFSSTIDLNTVVDKSLIGGLIIQVDEKQLDLSVSRQIKELRSDFMKIDFNNKKKKNK